MRTALSWFAEMLWVAVSGGSAPPPRPPAPLEMSCPGRMRARRSGAARAAKTGPASWAAAHARARRGAGCSRPSSPCTSWGGTTHRASTRLRGTVSRRCLPPPRHAAARAALESFPGARRAARGRAGDARRARRAGGGRQLAAALGRQVVCGLGALRPAGARRERRGLRGRACLGCADRRAQARDRLLRLAVAARRAATAAVVLGARRRRRPLLLCPAGPCPPAQPARSSRACEPRPKGSANERRGAARRRAPGLTAPAPAELFLALHPLRPHGTALPHQGALLARVCRVLRRCCLPSPPPLRLVPPTRPATVGLPRPVPPTAHPYGTQVLPGPRRRFSRRSSRASGTSRGASRSAPRS
jgi:hypothetical protein